MGGSGHVHPSGHASTTDQTPDSQRCVHPAWHPGPAVVVVVVVVVTQSNAQYAVVGLTPGTHGPPQLTGVSGVQREHPAGQFVGAASCGQLHPTP
jgi:hypothetical protein